MPSLREGCHTRGRFNQLQSPCGKKSYEAALSFLGWRKAREQEGCYEMELRGVGRHGCNDECGSDCLGARDEVRGARTVEWASRRAAGSPRSGKRSAARADCGTGAGAWG